MTYTGHLPDGSGIQRHSAGAFYPYVLRIVGDDFVEIVKPNGCVSRAFPLGSSRDERVAAYGAAIAHAIALVTEGGR